MKRIQSFKSFDDDFLLESLINESMLYFSPRLRKYFSKMDNDISKKILDMESTNIKDDITFVDVAEDSDGFLTFIKSNSAIRNLKNIYKDVNHINDLALDTTDFLWNNRHNEKGSNIYNNSRNTIKLGKFVNKLFNGKLNSIELEKFTNEFKSKMSESKEIFEIIEGKDIEFWYDRKNYLKQQGTLGMSCMAHMNGIFNIYTENPKVCKLLILKSGDKIIGRALIWKLNTIEKYDGEPILANYYMDRIYTIDDYQVNQFQSYAIKKGWAYNTHNNSSYNSIRISFNGEIFGGVRMSVKIKRKEYMKYPYLDTFTKYDSINGILYNDLNYDKKGHTLTRTNGGYDSGLSKRRLLINRFRDFITNA